MTSVSRRRIAQGALIVAAGSLAAFAGRLVPGMRGTPDIPDELCILAPPLPYDPALHGDRYQPRVIPDDARCPVCGMYPVRFPRWAAQAIYRNGATQFFDSPLNLHVFLTAVGRFAAGYRREDIAATYVTDIMSGEWTDAASAWYVHGSGVTGPMREGNLPAFREHDAAQRFAAERGGEVLPAERIDAGILRSLYRPSRHEH